MYLLTKSLECSCSVPSTMCPLTNAFLGRGVPDGCVQTLEITSMYFSQYISVLYARSRASTVLPNLTQHIRTACPNVSGGASSTGRIVQGTHRPRDTSAKGRIVQGTHRPRDTSAKGHIGQGTHRPRDTSSKGRIA
jgi:hypothetical protein